jgi:hypothetical protein
MQVKTFWDQIVPFEHGIFFGTPQSHCMKPLQLSASGWYANLPAYAPHSKSIAESTESYIYIFITQSVFVEVDIHKTVY